MAREVGLNIDGNEMKKINEAKSISYTDRDYDSIKQNLIDSIEDLTSKWTSRDEADPGIVLIKLISEFGDLLSYNLDRQILECFPNSVTQRKNAQQLYGLVGYKMRWYKSASCICNIVNTYQMSATMLPFTKFETNTGITYTYVYDADSGDNVEVELRSNINNNGQDREVLLIQGSPVTPSLKTGQVVPGPNKPWHDIYNYNISSTDIIDNKIIIPIKNIDQDTIVLIDDTNEKWELVTSVATQMSVGKFFELRIDEYDNPYLYLVNYWKNYDIKNFKLFYLQTLGEAGQITEGALTRVTSGIYSTSGPVENQKTINVASEIKLANFESTVGYNPETADEARENATKYVNTADTLVTLDDFTRYVMRIDGVANCVAMDLTNDPGTQKQTMYGDLDGDGQVTQMDRDILAEYLDNPYENSLTEEQYKLADVNGDGKVNVNDLDIFDKFLNGQVSEAGRCSDKVTISTPLPPLTVKIYIALTDDYEDASKAWKEEYCHRIQTLLADTKHIALNIIVDVNSIKNYYWTAKGTVYLKQPVSVSEANDILVNIKNQVQFDFRPEETEFNKKVKFIDVVHSIEDKVDTLIDHVDLEPIEYFNDEGEKIDPKLVKGEFTIDIPINPVLSDDPASNLIYNIQLEHTPIRPNFITININDGEVILKDNGNGKISSVNGILQQAGTVDYGMGKIQLKFNSAPQSIKLTYSKNQVVMVRYTNFSTLDFNVASENIKQ